MSLVTRYLFLVTLFLTGAGFALNVQSQTKTPVVQRATIAGKITIKGKPAPGIVVSLQTHAYSIEPPPRATTDREGHYRFNNVLPGNCEIRPIAPGFVVTGLPFDNVSKMIVVSEGENIADINFSLVRGGVITGRITDADGRPAIQQLVQLLRAEAFNTRPEQQKVPQPQVGRVMSVDTDDRGVYRMFGLAAGSYKVGVGGVAGASYGRINQGRAVFSQVFYPDAIDPLKATIVEVSEGSESTNIDIALGTRTETFSVSGRVEDESGQPVPNIQLALLRVSAEPAEYVSQLRSTKATGEFLVENLIPGKYNASIVAEPNAELRSEPVAFEVIDQNVTGVTIRAIKGASISGVLVLESENKTAATKLFSLMLGAQVRSLNPSSSSRSTSSRIGTDGSFRLTPLPAGTANMYLSGSSSDQVNAFVITRIERDGVVQAGGVEVKDREQITGLRVFLSFGNATLRGVVNLQNGSLPAGSSLMLRLSRPGEPNANTRSPRLDSRGHFLLNSLTPGIYEVSAHVYTPGVRPSPPVKQQVSLADGIVTDVVLTIDVAPRQP